MKSFLKFFGKLERPIGWSMLIASIIVFFGVLLDIIVTRDLKLPTLLLAAGLFCDGFSMAQDAEDNTESVATQVK